MALATATTRELVWGLGAVAREVSVWKARAGEIPDQRLRHEALSSLARKRGHTYGAALFWTIPRTRDFNLLRLLVAYEIIWDFLDGVNERGAAAGQANGRQLHLALIDALDLNRPVSAYYEHHPWKDDGGYLRTLVAVCRESCVQLPSYRRVHPLLVQEATRAEVLAINHDLDPVNRDMSLRAWGSREFSDEPGFEWFELSGAASASLTIHALLVLAAQSVCSDREIAQTYRAYFPWISAATTMLDSYVDQAEDHANSDHSYIAHYPTSQIAARRLCQLAQSSLHKATALPNGEGHTLIVACMIAMYLSKDSARTQTMRETTRSVVHASGPLTRMLLPILRLWRIAYRQRSA